MAFTPHHLQVQAEELFSAQPGGRFFFLPGSSARASAIAEHFEDRHLYPSPRGHDVHLGRLRRADQTFDVGVVHSGMGCPSVDIIVTELIGLGIRRLLRIGTAGSLQPHMVKAAHVVVATAAVRDEGTSLTYAPAEVPAVASWQLVQAAQAAAADVLDPAWFHLGIVHTKDSLYARELGYGPLSVEHQRYRTMLRSLGVLASEMEAAHLFMLAQAYTGDALASTPSQAIWAGAILGIVGDDQAFGSKEQQHLAEQRAIAVGLETAYRSQGLNQG